MGMKLKYLLCFSIVFLLAIPGIADDSIYVKAGNEIIKGQDYRIIVQSDILSDVLIDNNSLYFYTKTHAYIVNITTGAIDYKLVIPGINDFKQTDNYLWLKTGTVLYQVNKTSGDIEQKTIFNKYIDAIYSLFGQGVMETASYTDDIVGVYPIVVTGGATKTISITPSFGNLYVKTITRNTTGDIPSTGDIYPTLYAAAGGWILDVYNDAYGRNTNITIYDQEIQLNSNGGVIELNSGQILVNGEDLEVELIKNSIKSFQADYLNSSGLVTDLVMMPQDLKLTNVSSLIEASGDNFTLNISIEEYTSYPGSKFNVTNFSMTSAVNYFDDLDFDFDNKDVVLLNYTSAVNVSKSNTMFKFKVR